MITRSKLCLILIVLSLLIPGCLRIISPNQAIAIFKKTFKTEGMGDLSLQTINATAGLFTGTADYHEGESLNNSQVWFVVGRYPFEESRPAPNGTTIKRTVETTMVIDAKTGVVLSVGQANVYISPPPSRPEGTIEGGWVYPLPPGRERGQEFLTQEEWKRVFASASKDPEIISQKSNNNIAAVVNWWVSPGRSFGLYGVAYSEPEFIVTYEGTGASPLYPAIMFTYGTRTDRNGQLVAVDPTTYRILFSGSVGGPARTPRNIGP